MDLENFCNVFSPNLFPKFRENTHPEKEAVLRARHTLSTELLKENFLLDCISWELRRLKNSKLDGGLQPFYVIPDLGIRFAFGYWPPGLGAAPHEHTAWTITGVCKNQLEVSTFDREESYKRTELVFKNRFTGLPGDTGFIYEPCIHAPKNVSNDWSISFHVASPLDGRRPEDHIEPLSCLQSNSENLYDSVEHPYSQAIIARRKLRYIHQLARVLSSMNSQNARSVIKHCLEICSLRTRHEMQSFLEVPFEKDCQFERTNKNLKISFFQNNGMMTLSVDTPKGLNDELIIDKRAGEAINFALTRNAFNVHTLPGPLSLEEKIGIVEVLEETGLFKRIHN